MACFSNVDFLKRYESVGFLSIVQPRLLVTAYRLNLLDAWLFFHDVAWKSRNRVQFCCLFDLHK